MLSFSQAALKQIDLVNYSAIPNSESTVEFTPTYDPLATPMLSENPSEAERGEYLYYFHCMPCHGDLGQGLTDDFRNVWVEDHRNCWARGCHGGRPQEEGFPIPTYVPDVISKKDTLEKFADFNTLWTYLQDTHPPQAPGSLVANDYRAITVYLWRGNQKPDIEMTKAAVTLFEGDISFNSTETPQSLLTFTPSPSPSSTKEAPSGTMGKGLTTGVVPIGDQASLDDSRMLLVIGIVSTIFITALICIWRRGEKSKQR